MKTRQVLDAQDVSRLAEAAKTEARRNHWPVTIAIVDEGGHLLWLERGEGAAPATASIAIGKAQTAALGRRPSKFYEDMLNGGRSGFLSAPGLGCLLEGGLPIVLDGEVLGAIGVSGVKSPEDAKVAQAGCAAVIDRAAAPSISLLHPVRGDLP